MAKYLEIAKQYDDLPPELLELVPDEHKERAAEIIARLVNAGFRGNPRAANGTIRLNYIRAMCRKIPVRCDLVEVEKENGYSFKALTVEHVT